MKEEDKEVRGNEREKKSQAAQSKHAACEKIVNLKVQPAYLLFSRKCSNQNAHAATEYGGVGEAVGNAGIEVPSAAA